MGRMTTYVIALSGVMLLFYFGGLIGIDGSPTASLLNILLDPGSFQNTPLSTLIIGALQLVGAGVAVILTGVFRNIEIVASTSVTIFLFNLLWDFLVVIQKLNSVNTPLTVLIFSPLLIMMVLVAFDFWRGRD